MRRSPARKALRRFVAVLFVTLFLGWVPPAVPQVSPPDSRAPRLIVVVVIDQFRADYLTRFHEQFGPDGFNRLLREGASFTSCFYPHANTVTAVGHATLATGATPDRHGIVGNSWYDARLGRRVAAVGDESSPVVGSTADLPGVSPHNLVGTTLADELRLATGGEAKVFGVAIKDRSAIFSTGHSASGAYWYDYVTGRFVTSRYYQEELPDWVVAFNRTRGAGRYYGKDWKVGDEVFLSLTSESGQPDAEFYGRLPSTPHGNQLVIEFTQELVEQEGLGADGVTDYLFIGFSSNDMVGHRWGPYSDEVADMTLRTDAQMAELLKFLDRRVGEGNYWLAISADHGVAPLVEQARERGISPKTFDGVAVQAAVKKALVDRWGEAEWLVPRAGLTFDRNTLREHRVSLAQAVLVVGEAAMAFDAIIGYVGPHAASADPATIEFVRRSSYPGRSADVVLIQAPFASSEARLNIAMHGSHYSYDTHVPLIFFGPPFRPGVYPEQVSTTDLAVTLAAALGISPPALATGKVLSQMLRTNRHGADATGHKRK